MIRTLADNQSVAAVRIRSQIMDQLRQQAATFHGSGKTVFRRAEVTVEGLDALAWLCAQPPASRGYWSDRDLRFELAGVGRADVLTGRSLADYESLMKDLHDRIEGGPPAIRYFGGFRFDPDGRADPAWKSFQAYRFILPRFEVVRRGDESVFACNLRVDENLEFIETELSRVVFPVQLDRPTLPRVKTRRDEPDFEGWKSNVEAALQSISHGQYEKVVLGRATRLQFEDKLNTAMLLSLLSKVTRQRFHFCFQPDPDFAFIGASPERLYRREDRQLRTEAVAGTRARGRDPGEDRRLADDLLHHEKERREHAYVVEGIARSLTGLCESFESDEQPSILKLAQSQHLITSFRAELKEGVKDAHILRNLHPTPAVGGTPTARAVREIARLEPFDRGWYAGPVGWIGRGETEFAVAIRSALVQGDRLTLYAGAGIVDGSRAQEEWEEVENKIGDFTSLIQNPQS